MVAHRCNTLSSVLLVFNHLEGWIGIGNVERHPTLGGNHFKEHQVLVYPRALVEDYLRDKWIEHSSRSNILAVESRLRHSSEVQRPPRQRQPNLLHGWHVGASGWRRLGKGHSALRECITNCWTSQRIDNAPLVRSASDTPISAGVATPLIRVGEANVEVKFQMNYLGLIFDSHWRFERHFQLKRMVGALGRLFLDLRGPKGRIRHLYVGIVQSMTLHRVSRSPWIPRDILAQLNDATLGSQADGPMGRPRL